MANPPQQPWSWHPTPDQAPAEVPQPQQHQPQRQAPPPQHQAPPQHETPPQHQAPPQHQDPTPRRQAGPPPQQQAPAPADHGRIPDQGQRPRAHDHAADSAGAPMRSGTASMVADRPDHDQPAAIVDNGETPDPAPWVPTKALMIIAGIAVIALIITVIVCLLLWITPPLQPLDVPTVPAA